MVGCINEIGEKQKADNISGLFGENGLIEYLKTQETPLENGFLLRLGIDNFKPINEKFGWDYGDYILRKTAECISHCISGEQQVYKLSSDEFIIVDVTSDDKQTEQYTFTIKSGKTSTSLLKRIIIRQSLRFPVGFSHFIIFWKSNMMK